MDNTVTALQNLYVALGGTAEDVADINLIPDMINAIAQLPLSSSLPAVKAADNGKLLTVVEGKWATADAPKELPEVTAADNGAVLKVAEGVWAKGTDLTE